MRSVSDAQSSFLFTSQANYNYLMSVHTPNQNSKKSCVDDKNFKFKQYLQNTDLGKFMCAVMARGASEDSTVECG